MKRKPSKRRSRNTRIVRRKKASVEPKFKNISKVTARISGVFCVVLITYFVFAKVTDLVPPPEIPITDIRFTGLGHLDHNELLRRSNISGDTNLLSLDLKEVREKLLTEPYIREAEAERNFCSGVLTIKLQLRRPVALVNCNGLYGVDEAGVLLAEGEGITSCDLPLISGVDIGDAKLGKEIKTKQLDVALEILEHVSSSNLEAIVTLSEINVSNLKDVVVYVGREGVQLRLGADRFREKLDKATAILADLQNRGKKAKYIDFRFRKRIIVKPVE